MSSPDPEHAGLAATALAALAAIVGPIWAARSWLERRFSKKADKDETANCLRHIEALYKNAEADRAVTRDLHDKSMERIQQNQTQLIDILTRRS